jgi:hypothetical protein
MNNSNFNLTTLLLQGQTNDSMRITEIVADNAKMPSSSFTKQAQSLKAAALQMKRPLRPIKPSPLSRWESDVSHSPSHHKNSTSICSIMMPLRKPTRDCIRAPVRKNSLLKLQDAIIKPTATTTTTTTADMISQVLQELELVNDNMIEVDVQQRRATTTFEHAATGAAIRG